MTWMVTLEPDEYHQLYDGFTHEIPVDYNAAWDFVRKHDPDDVALIDVDPAGGHETLTFGEVDARSDAIAAGLDDAGVGRGDRVVIASGQAVETLLLHIACWKLAAISVPVSVLLGEKSVRYQLNDCGAVAAIGTASMAEKLVAVADECPALEHIYNTDDGTVDGATNFEELAVEQDGQRPIAETQGDTPAIIIYSSGTTGKPKGILHTHDTWISYYPIHYSYCEFSVEDNVYWTPGSWAWAASLGHMFACPWHFGRPIVNYPMKGFDVEAGYEVMETYGVTTSFLVATALRIMRKELPDPLAEYDLALETIISGGEAVTPEVINWVEDDLDGIVLNELFGTTETMVSISNSHSLFELRRGSMGKPSIGRTIAILDPETGEEKPPGESGYLACLTDEPGVFDRYWNKPEKTEKARLGDWTLTGDIVRRDEDDYYWFESRADELIITSGYRVSPHEVEDTILKHDGVKQAVVFGVPDEERGEIIKAVIEPTDASIPADRLETEVTQLVREELALYKYPRIVEVIDEMPQTASGKIKRAELR